MLINTIRNQRFKNENTYFDLPCERLGLTNAVIYKHKYVWEFDFTNYFIVIQKGLIFKYTRLSPLYAIRGSSEYWRDLLK